MKLNKTQKRKQLTKLHAMIGVSSWLVLATTLAGLGGLASISFFGWPINGRFGVVQSGSMEPSIPVGSLLWLSARASYNQSDVIAFPHPNGLKNDQRLYKNDQTKIIALHRVTEIKESGYLTKGDANQSSDPWQVPVDQVIGTVIYQIPYLGYLISWLQTPNGIVVSLVLPGGIIFSHLIRTIIQNKRDRSTESTLFTLEQNNS